MFLPAVLSKTVRTRASEDERRKLRHAHESYAATPARYACTSSVSRVPTVEAEIILADAGSYAAFVTFSFLNTWLTENGELFFAWKPRHFANS
ncbi:hypothetical protein D3C76_1188390 [compost metagenome]